MIINHNEPALLAAIVHDNTLLDSVSFLNGGDFSDRFYGHIYEAMKILVEEGKTADIVTISERVARVSRGDTYHQVYEAISASYAVDNVPLYARAIKDQAKKKHVLEIFSESIRKIGTDGTSIDQVIMETVTFLSELENQTDEVIRPIGHLAPKFFELLDKRMTSKNGLSGISTGFKNLDALTSGLQGGQLIVLGARPGNGKTTLALNMATNHANAGGAVAFFSLEMSELSIYERLIASESGVQAKNIKTGQLDAQSIEQLLKASNDFRDKKLFLLDAENVQDIARLSRQIKRHHDLSFVVVDYLGLLLNGKHEHAHLVLGEITRVLKKIAIQLNVPILLLSQLNREVEKRGDPTPILSDLRQSGSIEQDADIVMFITQYDKDKPHSPLHGYGLLDIAKHRDGQTDTLVLSFEGRRNRFVETTMTFCRFDELRQRQKPEKKAAMTFPTDF